MTRVSIVEHNGLPDGTPYEFDVNKSVADVVASYDPFQHGWTATTPDDFRALLREVLADSLPYVDVNDVRRAAGL